MAAQTKFKKIYSPNWRGYELIDAGNEKKLERWGDIFTIRPERQAYFKSVYSIEKWKELAHLSFIEQTKKSGHWRVHKSFSESEWTIRYKEVQFLLQTTQFKHVGIFPEQVINWKLILDFLQPNMKMLNLFAYTGAASIIGRSTGASVTHVDSVKQLITWARKNMEASQLNAIRWVHEDALTFAQREVKRGNFYHFIIMDPPAWGIGAKKEKWKLENQLDLLIKTASQLLYSGGLLVLNTYSPKVSLQQINDSATVYFNNLEVVELWKKTTTQKKLYYGNLLRAYN